MMWVAKIYDTNEVLVQGKLTPNVSPAIYFAGCVQLVLRLLNGGSDICKEVSQWGKTVSLNPEEASSLALVIFLSTLHQHPFFPPNIVENVNDPNYSLYSKFATIMEKDISDTSVHAELVSALSQFKVPGISRINISSTSSINQLRLNAINFPDDLIPSHYKCILTEEVMTQPCSAPKHLHAVVNYDAFIKALDGGNNKNPFTRENVDREELVIHTKLSAEIELFIQKAEWIYERFQAHQTYNTKYTNHSEILLNPEVSFDEFQRSCVPIAPGSASTLSRISILYAQIQHVPICVIDLFPQYKMAETKSPTEAQLETLLRRICFAGQATHLNLLLTHVAINVNANNNLNKRTALHWVVIGANQCPTDIARYQSCYELLLAHKASLDVEDTFESKHRKPMDYDEKHLFADQASLQPQVSAS